MVCENRSIYGYLGISWVLITLVPRLSTTSFLRFPFCRFLFLLFCFAPFFFRVARRFYVFFFMLLLKKNIVARFRAQHVGLCDT